ncbi:ALP1-like protein [Tanacetum coccineum]
MAYFSEHPQYDESTFLDRFRMSRRLFTKIVREVTDASPFLEQTNDCTGNVGISSLMKCPSTIRQMAYGAVPDTLDEYLKMGATTARKSLQMFCKAIMELYGEEFLRKPTYTDMEKLYAHHDENHGFSRMMNNDVNVLRQSPLFNDLKSGRAPDVSFVANNVPYKRGYYLTDGIYPQWAIIKSIIHDNGEAICPDFFQEEQHRDDDPVRTHEESMQVTQEIINITTHLSLKADLVKHIWNKAN